MQLYAIMKLYAIEIIRLLVIFDIFYVFIKNMVLLTMKAYKNRHYMLISFTYDKIIILTITHHKQIMNINENS